MKKISVIIPCYNSSKYLDDCFQSLISQTIGIEQLEIIFINDASLDNTGDMLNQYEALYPESIMVIHLSENVKQGGARNIGLEYASGKYILFLDSDDWLSLSFLEEVYEIAEENDIDILQFPFVNVTFDGTNVVEQKNPVYWQGLHIIEDTTARKHFLTEQQFNCGSQCKLYKAELIHTANARFLAGVAYEEPSFVYPLFFYAKRVYSFEKWMYFCRQHNTSTMKSYITKPGKLYDHPFVQLSIYKQLREDTEIYSLYKEEIDFYFLFTFYIETLYFSKLGNLHLGYDFFLLMQDTVKNMLPAWQQNKYLSLLLTKEQNTVLSSIDKIYSQEAFLDFKKSIQ